MSTTFLHTIPVLPSADLARDVPWYQEKLGLQVYFADNMYAVLYRDNLILHLQWHADTADDPLLGGSVVRVLVKNIRPLFEEFVQRGTVTADKLRINTPWKTMSLASLT
ncbi:VOC family protein [Dawidia soli]|uniref:glyoxalase/bleomycin resistance/extradiol dioxygenase family protein n=1 Tax=Dawidia soli TaxID=2782352 RepID=UPI0020B3332D|nr:glyoxalase/bleomycin resistance/extradiol dioxygenase family protein [Dawidia soli]